MSQSLATNAGTNNPKFEVEISRKNKTFPDSPNLSGSTKGSKPAEPVAPTASDELLADLVENAGDAWPAETADVVRAFWQLLEDADVARFEHLERLAGGAFRSEGKYESGKMWHLIIPGIGSDALAVEVRGPNASWVIHADVFFDDVVILE